MKDLNYLIGIDEAGRGPLAGPVAVAAVMATPEILKKLPLDRDSKQLTEREREYWYGKIRAEEAIGNLKCSHAFSKQDMIDKKGIVGAIEMAVKKTLSKLPIDKERHQLFFDGNLKGPSVYKKQQTIIKGDETVSIISLASVIAKVERDVFMKKIAEKYPAYGFDRHKGYATEDHYLALLQFGPCSIHRRTYIKSLLHEEE